MDKTEIPIYTHDEAARIVELFEDILVDNDIYVPSPEDDECDPDNLVGLYGTTYGDLLDAVEERLKDMLDRHRPWTKVVENFFSGTT